MLQWFYVWQVLNIKLTVTWVTVKKGKIYMKLGSQAAMYRRLAPDYVDNDEDWDWRNYIFKFHDTNHVRSFSASNHVNWNKMKVKSNYVATLLFQSD